MPVVYIGLDPIESVELYNKGKLYISLYHECKLDKIIYDGNLQLSFRKTYSAYKGEHTPKMNQRMELIFYEADIDEYETFSERNYEDISDLKSISHEQNSDEKVNFYLEAACASFWFKASKVELKEKHS